MITLNEYKYGHSIRLPKGKKFYTGLGGGADYIINGETDLMYEDLQNFYWGTSCRLKRSGNHVMAALIPDIKKSASSLLKRHRPKYMQIVECIARTTPPGKRAYLYRQWGDVCIDGYDFMPVRTGIVFYYEKIRSVERRN